MQHNGERAALKVYGPNTQVLRVQGEIDKLGQLQSPNVVGLRAFGDCDIRGLPCRYVLLEFVDGVGGEDLIGQLDDASLRDMMSDVARGLDAMWEPHRIVHRDLKPHNIMRRNDGTWVVLDLGLAKAPEDDTITGQGMVVGTPGYMSPEQAGGSRRLTIRSDLFALGLTAYEMACGKHPYLRIQRLVGQISVDRLDQVCAVSEETGQVVERLMAVDRFQRPASSTELFQAEDAGTKPGETSNEEE